MVIYMSDPIILAIDTSTEKMTVAICRGKEILLEETREERHHSRHLLQFIDQCLSQVKLSHRDIDAFAATIGPGSFTGVRTGLGTIKSLAFSNSKPLIGIPTLLAMAYPCDPTKIIAPVLEARKGFVYTGQFQNQNNAWIEIQPASMMSLEDFHKHTPASAFVVGRFDGNSEFKAIYGKTLCEISLQKFINKEFEDVQTVEPLYIQKTAAEGYV